MTPEELYEQATREDLTYEEYEEIYNIARTMGNSMSSEIILRLAYNEACPFPKNKTITMGDDGSVIVQW